MAMGPVGDVTEFLGNIGGKVADFARATQEVSPEALQIAEQARTRLSTAPQELAQALLSNAQLGQTALQNAPTAVGGFAASIPAYATQVARGMTDIIGSGAELVGFPEQAQRIREEGKLAEDTAKNLAAQSTANLRQFFEGKPTDVEGEAIAEELTPQKKQGAFAKAQRARILWAAENMTPEEFKTKYPDALPIDIFNAAFEQALQEQSLPNTVKQFFVDMPLESVKMIYGAINGDPETVQKFKERPLESFVEIGVGLGAGAHGLKMAANAPKALADLPSKIQEARVRPKPQTKEEAAESFMANQRQEADFLRKQNEMRDQMAAEKQGAEQARTEAMTGEVKGMTEEDLAATVRPTPEPAPTVIQQPQTPDARLERVQPEFQQPPRPEMRPQPVDQLFRRERTITQPEAATTPAAEPEGIKPQAIAPTVTQPAPITFRKEAERKIKPEPENKGIIARPAAEVGIKEYEKLPENVWLHGTDIDGEIKNFSVTDTERGVYLTKNWSVAENYTDGDTAKIKAIELKKDANIFDLNDDAQAEKLAKLLKERIDDFADFDIKEFAANLQKADYNQVGLIDNAEIGNVLYEANVDAVIDTKGNAAIINDNALKTYRPEGKGMTATGQPTPEAMLTRTNKTSLLSEEKFWEIVETAKSQDEIRPYAEQVLKNKAAFSSDAQQIAARAMPEIQKEANTRYEQNKKDIMGRYERSKEFVMESIGGETPLLKKLGYDINGKMYRGVKSEAAINDLFTKKSVMTKTGEGTTNWAPDTYSRYMFDKDTHSGYIIESDATPDNFQTFTKFSNKYYKSKGPIPLENISRIIKIERTKPEVGVNKDTVGHEVIYDRDAGINKIKSVQPAEPMAVKTPEVKGPSNVEIAQQNFNRIMNAQPYELTLEDYIYQKQQKARVYRKPTGQKDRQEMKSRIREVGDQYAPDEHKNAVKSALAEGKPVPPEVLAEYPDLNQPRPKTGPSMFGGAQLQNAYEKVEPVVKRGLDIFKKKTKEFIADEEGFYSPEELAKAVKAVKDKFIGSIKRGQSTQVTNTVNTYAKILDRIADKAQGKVGDVRVVDVSTGLGMSKELAENLGYKNYETTEPFPAKGFVPTFKDSSQLQDNAYDFITNNQVLNVVPKEIRDGIVKDIGRALKEGGTAIISTRGKDVMAATTGRAGEESMSLYIPAKDAEGKSYEQYQKGFTNQELKDYVQGLLGDGFEVKTAPFGAAGVEITKTKTKEAKPGRVGMFGAGQLQNAYEKVEPTLKKGADLLFKKGKKFVEDESGMFSPSKLIDGIAKAVGARKAEKPFEVTIGDPALAKEFETTFKKTQAAEQAKKQFAKSKEQSMASAYKQGLVDLFSPIIDRVPKGPEREALMASLHDIFYLGAPAEAFMRKTQENILKPVEDSGKTYADYSAWRAAKWTTTGRAKVETPENLKRAEDFLKSVDPQTTKQFEKITEDFHEKVWKPLLEEVKASGLNDPLIVNNIMNNENYSPFFPAKQLGLPHGIGENAPSAGIFKLKGGIGDYQDPLSALMQKGISMLTAAKINKGKIDGIEAWKKFAPKDIQEAMPDYKGFYKEKDPMTGQITEIPLVEFAEPQAGSNLALLRVREGGKQRGYYVPKEFARAFDMAMGEGDTLGATMKAFQKMTQGFRNVWIEYNPAWQVAVNAPRDIAAATIEMPKIGNRFKFMGNLAKVAPAAVGDYVPILGKIVQHFTGYDRKAFEKDVTKMLGESKLLSTREPQYLGELDLTTGERMQRAYGLSEKSEGVAKLLDTVQAFGKDIERMTKVAAELTLKDDKRFTDPEVKNIIRRIGSPAFGVRGGGDLFKTIKTATMFYNASKEGWMAAKYFLEKDPVGAIAFASVPMALYASTILAEQGTFGDDAKKAYSLMKRYDKENKLNFPIGYGKDGQEVQYISLPVPQFLKPVMRIMRMAAKESPAYLDAIVKGFSEELPALNPVVGLINRTTSYGDEKPPASAFGQEIMTQDQWDAGGEIKGSAFLKSFWNDYLLGSQWRLKVKPNERDETWGEKFFKLGFGKVYKTASDVSVDTSASKKKGALERLFTREAASATTPEDRKAILKDMKEQGLTPSLNVFKTTIMNKNIEKMAKEKPLVAKLIMTYRSSKDREEKIRLLKKIKELINQK